MGEGEMAVMAATDAGGKTATKAEEESALQALQQHLQLEAFSGKYLTRQEILLQELFDAMDAGSDDTPLSLGSQESAASSMAMGMLSPGAKKLGATTTSLSSTTMASSMASAASHSGGGTGKAMLAHSSSLGSSSSATGAGSAKSKTADRARVQSFLAQRQHSTGVSGCGGAVTPSGNGSSQNGFSFGGGGSGVSGNSSSTASGSGSNSMSSTGTTAAAPLSALDRARMVMAKKASTTGSTSSSGVKRVNPLADILKGGSGSVVGGALNASKRPRSSSSGGPGAGGMGAGHARGELKPGEIRLHGGRGGSIQLPVESFLRREDWDSSSDSALHLVLPEVAFATNNTLLIHATMPPRASRCCFNISTHTSMLSGAPYPGTVLYHFNPRRPRGGHVIQNSNIDGRWGCAQPLPRCPIVFGEPFTLRLTIVPTGFLVLVEEIFQDEFKHRVPIREGENLVLTVPTRDENGNPEGVIVHSVWWGHAEPPANIDVMQRRGPGGGAGGNGGPAGYHGRGGYRGMGTMGGGPGGADRGGGGRFNATPHPFEVYVGNLPPGTTREDLSFLFQYLGYETVRITARGFGFVTLRSAEDMHRAVGDLDGRELNGMKIKVSVAMAPR